MACVQPQLFDAPPIAPGARIRVAHYLPAGAYLETQRVYVLWREIDARRVTDRQGRVRKFHSEAAANSAARILEQELSRKIARRQ